MPDTRDIPPRLALTSDYWELATVPPVVVAPLPGTRLYVGPGGRRIPAALPSPHARGNHAMTKDRSPHQTIGQPYTLDMLDRYDWHGVWPLVDVNTDGTVGVVRELVSDGDHWVTVSVRDGRVAESGDFANDAAALRCELVSAGLLTDEDPTS